MLNGLDKLTESLGQSVKTVPEIYDDALKPAAQETGKLFAIVPQTINAALLPLRKWNMGREYNFKEAEKLLAKKLEHVSPEEIVTPESYVAVPAIQALSYSIDSEELRNLYTNLISKSMRLDTKDNVHPSFVEIIKQLSPADANIFSYICELGSLPVIDILISIGIEGFVESHFSYTNLEIYPKHIIQNSISNLLRLGLIEIPAELKIANSQSYDELKKHAMNDYSIEFDYPITPQYDFIEKIILITPLGESFYDVCISEQI